MDIDTDETPITYTDPEVKKYWESKTGQPYGEPEQPPVMLYSIGLNAEDLLATYGALRMYLKSLASQEDETQNLGQIQRVAKLLIELNPRAVRASKEVSLRAVGTGGANARES